jgi:hypothetical protein
MAIACNVSKIIPAASTKRVTLPIVGLYTCPFKTKAQGLLLYIDHLTSTEPDAPRSYHKIPVIPKNPNSDFSLLAASCGVDVSKMSQSAACNALAPVLASKGGIECLRTKGVGGNMVWSHVKLVDVDTELLPWVFPIYPGMELTPLLVLSVPEETTADEPPAAETVPEWAARMAKDAETQKALDLLAELGADTDGEQ